MERALKSTSTWPLQSTNNNAAFTSRQSWHRNAAKIDQGVSSSVDHVQGTVNARLPVSATAPTSSLDGRIDLKDEHISEAPRSKSPASTSLHRCTSGQSRRSDRTDAEGESDRGTSTVTCEAIEPPPGYPPLDFRPTILKTHVTIILCCMYTGLAVGMSLLAVLPDGKIPYSIKSDLYYLAVQYGPGLVAAISTFLFKTTAREVLRMLPYINMADPKGPYGASYTVTSKYWPTQYSRNTWGTWVNALLLFLSPFLISYKSALLEIIKKGDVWEVYVHTSIAIPLIMYYTIMALYMLVLAIWLWRKSTGIRSGWEPLCLADTISLFACFNQSLTDTGRADDERRIPPTIPEHCYTLTYRLGYWRLESAYGSRILYGIRALPVRKSFPRRQQRLEAKVAARAEQQAHKPYLFSKWIDIYQWIALACRRRKLEAKVAARAEEQAYKPYLFSKWIDIYYWIALALLSAWLIVIPVLMGSGFIKHGFAVLDDWSLHRIDHFPNATLSYQPTEKIRYNPLVPGPQQGASGSRSVGQTMQQVLLKTLPLFTMSFVASTVDTQDAWHRFTQPIYNMLRQPSLASDCLLLDYLTRSPFGVTSQAFEKGHWKVFAYSLLGSAPDFLMLIPYGSISFTTAGTASVGHFSFSAVIETYILLVLFSVLLLSSWPTERRSIPRPYMSLLDIWSFCHKSEIASEPCFSMCEPHWTKHHLHGHITALTHKYLMGRCRDEHDNVHIGFDIYRRGPEAVLTNWVEWVRPKHLRFWKNRPGVQNKPFPDEDDDEPHPLLPYEGT